MTGGLRQFKSGGYLSSTETLTAESSEWVQAGALPSARDGLRGATIDNHFYVLGECSQGSDTITSTGQPIIFRWSGQQWYLICCAPV